MDEIKNNEENEDLIDDQFEVNIEALESILNEDKDENIYSIQVKLENSQVEIEEGKENIEIPSEDDIEFELELEPFEENDQEDKLWKIRTGLNEDTLSGAIETLVFMSDRPVSLLQLRKIIDEEMPLRVLRESIERLQKEYEAKHHGIRLMEVAEGYHFRTKPTFSSFVQDLFKVNSLVLSPTALEVLAIIAYKQPISRSDVDKIRGVDSSHIVRSLIDKRLVKVVGRSEDIGRPVVYGTTQEFLEVFNLSDLSGLPTENELTELSQQNELGKISDIQSICAGDKEKFKFDELEELDKLSEQINEIIPETPFINSLKVEEKKRSNNQNENIKSAFQLLEEFVEMDKIRNQNIEAASSALFAIPDDISVVSDLLAGPFNVPETDDDFEMIDLDTGEAVKFDIDEDLIEEMVDETYESMSEDDELFEDSTDAENALSIALDEAFNKIQASECEKDELDLNDKSLEQKEIDIDALTAKMLAQADELDIDLSFLDNPENPNS